MTALSVDDNIEKELVGKDDTAMVLLLILLFDADALMLLPFSATVQDRVLIFL